MPTLLLKILFFPFYLFWVVIEELTGSGRAYRRRYRAMAEERTGMGPMEFALAAGATQADVEWVIAVRAAIAESTGLPADALHAQDPLPEIWAMQMLGPDLLDVVLRLEMATLKKIPREVHGGWQLPPDHPATLGTFALWFGTRLAEADRAGKLQPIAPPDSRRATAQT